MDEEVLELMNEHDIDEETAERAVELIEEFDIDEETAIEMAEDGI